MSELLEGDAMSTPYAGVPPRRRRSHGASAVVTGAGSGIGRAFARELASRGGRVVCADIDLERARETAALIGDGRAHGVACDVTSYEQVESLAKTAADWFGQPADLVINNAGIGTGGKPIGEISMADWKATIDVNMWGMVYGCQVFTPSLRAQGSGGIINVSSAASFGAAPLMGAYNVSKAAVLALSETLRAELAGTGVRVTVLCPTVVKTSILENGRISSNASGVAALAFKFTGFSPERVARKTLNAHDWGRFYVMPQLEAKLGWSIKRHAPNAYGLGMGLVSRLARLLPEEIEAKKLWEAAYDQESIAKVSVQ